MNKICQQCNKEFEKAYTTSQKVFGKQKYCGQKCFGLAKRGKEGYWSGKERRAPEYLEKISLAHKGQHSSPATQFKKAQISAYAVVGSVNEYRNLHKWVEKQLGRPEKCSVCGKIGYGRQIHWANKSKRYLKEISDWIRLCVKCHYQFDENRKVSSVNNIY